MPTLKFFLPFEFDQVPKKWYPWEDKWVKGERLYIWECLNTHPYDGLLISKTKFDSNKNRVKSFEPIKDLKKILQIPERIKLFGDCGAFQYIDKDYPIYTATEILDYYQEYGFDMGCSIDHIITPKLKKNVEEREKRYEITKEFAEKCIDQYNCFDYSFELFGVAQGWNLQSYSRMIDYLYELGYKNICLGGLVGLKTADNKTRDFSLFQLIKGLKSKFNKYKFERVHIFGRGDLSILDLCIESGITQFDNNIMRKAWTDEKKSYHLFKKNNNEMKYYTSIRIPLIDNTQGTQKEESEIFRSLNDLDQKKISEKKFISELAKYYQVIEKINIEKSYKINLDLLSDLLKDKPWDECECDICRKYGIHVCVFRRRMRNTIRAFHNVYNYYSYITSKRFPTLSKISDTRLTDFT